MTTEQAILLLESRKPESEAEKQAIEKAIHCMEKDLILRAQIISLLREFIRE